LFPRTEPGYDRAIETASTHESALNGAGAEGEPASVPSLAGATKLEQTVTSEGEYVAKTIDGVVTRPSVTHPDERGTVCEIYNPAWGLSDEPLVYVYQITIRPQQVKGFVLHRTYSDRLFFSFGTVKVVLFDDREGSPTRGMLNELNFSDHNRTHLVIPPGVWHAMKNVGTTDAVFVNCPTKPYNHEDPDKWTLPKDSDLIPYRF
jgi:dTDP-4-dehydrorhamnose 3,5-epimerase